MYDQKKIILLSHSSEFDGGADYCFLETAKALSLGGHQVFCVFKKTGELPKRIAELNVQIIYEPNIRQWVGYQKPIFSIKYLKYWLSNFYRHIKAIIVLFSLLKKIKPNVTITSTQTVPALAFASMLGNVKHYWYIHEFGDIDHNFYFDFGKNTSRFFMKKLSEKIVFNSEVVKKHFNNPKNGKVLYYVVDVFTDPSSTPKIDQNNPTFLMLGRATPNKGQHIALNAFLDLVTKHPNARLIIIGLNKSSYSETLRKTVEKSGYAQNITLIDFTPNPWDFAQGCLALLVCSKAEAFGRITVEALKQGVLPIVANTGASPEIVLPLSDKLIFDYPDEKHLSQKMEELILSDIQELNMLAQKGYQMANQLYSYKAHLEAWNQIIDNK